MPSKTEPRNPSPEISLVRGGPFYRLQEATRLIGPKNWNLGRRITLAIIIGWLVPVLIVLPSNPAGAVELIKSYPVASRMLIAVPVLLAGLTLIESRFREIVHHLYNADFLDEEDLPRMNEILATLVRLRDSAVPELLILLIVAARTASVYKVQVIDAPALVYGTAGEFHLTAAGWYGVLVSGTLFQFLLLLNIWKWLLWIYFAFKLSRLDLKLVPTHPDGNGGLGFLGVSPIAFAPTAFALATVVGAMWRQQIIHNGALLMTFKLPAIALVVIIALIALGPLVLFVPKLEALRRRGILEYSIVGQIQSTEFHHNWILSPNSNKDGPTEVPEVISLLNYGLEFDRIKTLNPFPTDKAALIGLALAVVLPALPTILAVIPLTVVLKDLLQALR
jgi:hypothetical protein